MLTEKELLAKVTQTYLSDTITYQKPKLPKIKNQELEELYNKIVPFVVQKSGLEDVLKHIPGKKVTIKRPEFETYAVERAETDNFEKIAGISEEEDFVNKQLDQTLDYMLAVLPAFVVNELKKKNIDDTRLDDFISSYYVERLKSVFPFLPVDVEYGEVITFALGIEGLAPEQVEEVQNSVSLMDNNVVKIVYK
mgnify:FL=1